MCKFSTHREQACTWRYTVLWETLCSARDFTETEFAKILFSGIFLPRTSFNPYLEYKGKGFINAMILQKQPKSMKWNLWNCFRKAKNRAIHDPFNKLYCTKASSKFISIHLPLVCLKEGHIFLKCSGTIKFIEGLKLQSWTLFYFFWKSHSSDCLVLQWFYQKVPCMVEIQMK